jgi:hypothetical protein
MTITAKLYGLFLKAALNKEIDIDSDTLKVMLTTSAYTPDQDTHDYKNDVTNEITGTGYTAGGAALTTVTVTYTTATNVLMVDDHRSYRGGVRLQSSDRCDATADLL